MEMPSISRSSWNFSGVHFRVRRGRRPSERTMPVKILPPILQRSSCHGMSSVASGRERQRARIWSASGMGEMIARGATPFCITGMPRSNARAASNDFVLHRVRIALPINDVLADHRGAFVTDTEGKHVGVPPKLARTPAIADDIV